MATATICAYAELTITENDLIAGEQLQVSTTRNLA